MAVKERSFWSTTSGVVTGVAGTLTGVVGIATVAAQLGWIGPSDDTDESASVASGSTVAGEDDRREPGAASRNDDRADPVFTVDPSSVSLSALGRTTATVTVRNTGDVDLTVEGVTVEGSDEQLFSVSAGACTRAAVAPGRSCAVEVSFSQGGGGSATATMVVDVRDARAQEVPLSGRSLL